MNAAAEQVPDRPSLVRKFASKYTIDPKVLMATLKATCFRQSDGEVSDEQMVSLLVVADQYNLNPFTKEIFAFPDKNKGIIPVVSVDGWVRIVNEHKDFNGYDVILPDVQIAPIPGERPAAWEWVTIRMHRRSVEFTPALTEYLDECYKPPVTKQGNNGPYTIKGPWQTHPKRFLRHKAFIQAGRLVFGFAGIYDEDEAQRILEASVVSTQVARTEGTKAADVAKENLRRQLADSSKAEPEQGSIEAGLRTVNQPVSHQEKVTVRQPREETITRELREATDEVASRKDPPPFKFDLAGALALLRTPGLDLSQLKANYRAICDDYEFSGRELPIDVEAIYRDLKEGLEQRGAS